jgi:O-phospho-L-seryl-tRNASec:L-selenocysteinyl-tRNA synthase
MEDLIPKNYLTLAASNNKSKEHLFRVLLEKVSLVFFSSNCHLDRTKNLTFQKKLPDAGWDDATIETFIDHLANLDSNNFLNRCGVGEREARIFCSLVKRRHYNLAHGVGRSGDLSEAQPKAAGSSAMAQLTNCLLLDLIKEMGVRSAEKALLVPMATGMTLVLCLLALKKQRRNADIVLWSRIDQKACFKAIKTAGLEPIIIDTVWKDGQLVTDTEKFRTTTEQLGHDNILCIYSTTSCFAPRNCDDIVGMAQLAAEHDIPHLINNAYGLQSTFYSHQIETAIKEGRVDLVVQSTDKNLGVPVGGAIVSGPRAEMIDCVSKTYAGRASSSQTLDVLMTLLSLGKQGYVNGLVRDRKDNFNYLKEALTTFTEQHKTGAVRLESKNNKISIALSLTSLSSDRATMLGSMLFTRGISGCRVVSGAEVKTIDGYTFPQWGAHTDAPLEHPYLTAAASLGITRPEIDRFVAKLGKVLHELNAKSE